MFAIQVKDFKSASRFSSHDELAREFGVSTDTIRAIDTTIKSENLPDEGFVWLKN